MFGMSHALVGKLSGFARLTPQSVAALKQATATHKAFPAGHDLIREGDTPGPVFVVLEGWVCRYKMLPGGGRQILAFLIPGDCCDLHVGMLAEMDHGIQTLTEASVSTIAGPAMEEILDAHPDIARAMYIGQLVDEGILRSWMVSMGRRSSIERVAHLMCELYLRLVKVEQVGKTAVTVPLSQVVLADALGMTPVHINRVLRELREAGAMQLQRRQLIIKDAKKLVHIAGFDEGYMHRRLRQNGKFL